MELSNSQRADTNELIEHDESEEKLNANNKTEPTQIFEAKTEIVFSLQQLKRCHCHEYRDQWILVEEI